MRGHAEIAARLAEVVVRRLVGRRFVEVKDEARARAALQRVLLENLDAEEKLDVEARRILEAHKAEIRDGRLDYRVLFLRTKEKLARDRGFIL